MRLARLLLSLWLLSLLAASGVSAQFSDQSNWGGTSGGSANAQTVAIANITAVPLGVPLRFIAGFTNTGALTVNYTSLGALSVLKPSPRGPIALTGGEVVATSIITTIYDGTNLQLQSYVPPTTASAYRNLVVTATSATAVTLTADEINASDTNGNGYRFTSVSVSCSISASGINGLDTGSAASNTWYSVSFAYNPSTNTRGCLLSTSATSGSPPSGYTVLWRGGWVRNATTPNLWRTIQYGRRAQIAIGVNPTTLPIIGTGVAGSITTPTWVALAVGSFVPTTASFICFTVSADLNQSALVVPNNAYGAQSSLTNVPLYGINSEGGASANSCMIMESTNIFWASDTSAARVVVSGWEDNL